MDEKRFEKEDRAFMAAFRPLREKPSDAAGLAASVERRIRAGAAPARPRAARALPWLVPALALSLVLAVPALRPGVSVPEGRVQIASAPATVDEEIAVLKELGVWTEEDDSRVAPESEFEAVELSGAPGTTRIV